MPKNAAHYHIHQEKPGGPYHDFWLFREQEREYGNYSDLLGRRDAPLRLSDDLMRYFYDTLAWVPTFNPANPSQVDKGLNLYGPTIINRLGGEKFAVVLGGWCQLLRLGPEQIILSAGSMGIVGENGEIEDSGWHKMEVARDEILEQLNLLAEWGAFAATGEFFILHLGV